MARRPSRAGKYSTLRSASAALPSMAKNAPWSIRGVRSTRHIASAGHLKGKKGPFRKASIGRSDLLAVETARRDRLGRTLGRGALRPRSGPLPKETGTFPRAVDPRLLASRRHGVAPRAVEYAGRERQGSADSGGEPFATRVRSPRPHPQAALERQRGAPSGPDRRRLVPA